MTLVYRAKTTAYWHSEYIFSAVYQNLFDYSIDSKIIFPDNTTYIVLPAVLLSVYRTDDLNGDYSAENNRKIQAGLALLEWFFSEEQNIEFVRSLYNRFGQYHPTLSRNEQIAATRSAPAPSAVPLGYSLFGLATWRQQYTTEDRYFGVV